MCDHAIAPRHAGARSQRSLVRARIGHGARRVALLLLLSSRVGAAQELIGTLRAASSGEPVAGVLVTLSRADDDALIERAFTSERGTYRIRAVTGEVIVRALRVGQQPVELGRLVLAAGEQRRLDAALPDIPVRLATLHQLADNRCTSTPGDRTLVAQLFYSARTALLTSQAQAEDSSVRAVLRRVVQRYDSRGREVGRGDTSWFTRASLHPFKSVDVDRLLDEGFRSLTPDGGMLFRAPGADVLTDDRFLAHYCLRLAESPPPDSGWVGITFEPMVRRRGMVQVAGTLWMERASQALRRVEFGYRGLEPSLNRATPGGVIEYLRTAEGIWFVPEWALRMPYVLRFSRSSLYGGEVDDAFVNGVLVTRGTVLEIVDHDGPRFTTGELELAPADSMLAARLVTYRDSARCAGASTLFGFRLTGRLTDAEGAPVAGALVRASWVIQRLVDLQGMIASEDREMFTHTDADGRFLLCGVPREHGVQLRAGPADAPIARSTIRIRDLQPAAHVELRVRIP